MLDQQKQKEAAQKLLGSKGREIEDGNNTKFENRGEEEELELKLQQ